MLTEQRKQTVLALCRSLIQSRSYSGEEQGVAEAMQAFSALTGFRIPESTAMATASATFPALVRAGRFCWTAIWTLSRYQTLPNGKSIPLPVKFGTTACMAGALPI